MTNSQHSSSSHGNTLLRVCRIGRAQGLHGEVNVLSFTDSPHMRFTPGAILQTKDGKEFIINKSRQFKLRWILHFEGINDRTAAETLKGTELFIHKSPNANAFNINVPSANSSNIDLFNTNNSQENNSSFSPKNGIDSIPSLEIIDDELEQDTSEYYFDDLIGLRAYDSQGIFLGEVINIIDRPAQPLLEIKEPQGNISLIPFVKEIVPSVNLADSSLEINPPGGLLVEYPPLSSSFS